MIAVLREFAVLNGQAIRQVFDFHYFCTFYTAT